MIEETQPFRPVQAADLKAARLRAEHARRVRLCGQINDPYCKVCGVTFYGLCPSCADQYAWAVAAVVEEDQQEALDLGQPSYRRERVGNIEVVYLAPPAEWPR